MTVKYIEKAHVEVKKGYRYFEPHRKEFVHRMVVSNPVNFFDLGFSIG